MPVADPGVGASIVQICAIACPGFSGGNGLGLIWLAIALSLLASGSLWRGKAPSKYGHGATREYSPKTFWIIVGGLYASAAWCVALAIWRAISP